MIESKIKPLHDFVLFEQESGDEEITTASGIIISSSDDKKQYHGVYAHVIAIGPECKNEKIQVGARIIINRYDSLDIREGSRTLGLIRGEELVYAVCEE